MTISHRVLSSALDGAFAEHTQLLFWSLLSRLKLSAAKGKGPQVDLQ